MRALYLAVSVCGLMALAGCSTFGETKVSMPYTLEVARTDQVVEGNRGYIQGNVPPAEDKTGRKRQYLAIDIDLPRSSKEAGIPDTKLINLSEGKTVVKFGKATEKNTGVTEEQTK